MDRSIPNFRYRGLEFHNDRMWKWGSVARALDFMEKYDMNMLIFHQNDLLDAIVLPQKYFSEEEMWEYWPVRYCTVDTRCTYINKVISEARKRKIDFYFEVKEIWYPENILEKFPGLRNEQGHICPTDPFWMSFLAEKTEELLRKVPDLSGIIVSPATRESKVSISANQCNCRRCQNTTEDAWYAAYIETLYRKLKKAGKRLIVRDFSYSVHSQDALLKACEDIGDDIILALKCVPHDFWPTFPNNPAVTRQTRLEKWIEYDTWGQYCGQGILPCSLIEDIISRHRFCLENGSTGIWYRTDWEALDECSNFNTLNMVNLIGATMHAKDPSCTPEEIFREWCRYGLSSGLTEESVMQPPVIPSADTAWDTLQTFMTRAYEILIKTIYVKGHVFQYSSRYQHSYSAIENVMCVWHNRSDWDPESAQILEATEENYQTILKEKEQALKEAETLAAAFDFASLGLPEAFSEELNQLLLLYPIYTEGFCWMAKVFFGMRLYQKIRRRDLLERVLRDNDGLKDFAGRLEAFLRQRDYPFYVRWIMEPDELKRLHADICRLAEEAAV